MVYDDRDYNAIRNKLVNGKNIGKRYLLNDIKYKDKILWDLYLDTDEKVFYKILYNYFYVVSTKLKNDWGNKNSLLTKTTGYNAMMMLFRDIYIRGLRSGELNKSFFENELYGLEYFEGRLTSENYGASGEKAAKDLYRDIIYRLER